MLTETTCYTGEFLLSEGAGSISRDDIVIAAGAAALVAGTVLGKVTATGKFVAYSNAANDGSEVAAGILYKSVPDSAADQAAVAVVRLAEVAGVMLTGLDGAAIADLATRNVIVR